MYYNRIRMVSTNLVSQNNDFSVIPEKVKFKPCTLNDVIDNMDYISHNLCSKLVHLSIYPFNLRNETL